MNAETALTSAHMTIDSAVAEWLAQKETIGSKRTRAEYEETMRRFRATLAQGGLDLPLLHILDRVWDIELVGVLYEGIEA